MTGCFKRLWKDLMGPPVPRPELHGKSSRDPFPVDLNYTKEKEMYGYFYDKKSHISFRYIGGSGSYHKLEPYNPNAPVNMLPPIMVTSDELCRNYTECNFRPGDKIVCIKSNGTVSLTNGDVYTVIRKIGTNIHLKELNNAFCSGRFVHFKDAVGRYVNNPCSEIPIMQPGQTTFVQPKKEEDKMKLYKIKLEDSEVFGTMVGEDADGKFVFKTDDGYVSVSKGKYEVVMPYTVDIRFGTNHQRYSYKAKKGQYEVNDNLIVNGMIGTVVAVDTRSPNATKNLVCKVLLTKDVGNEEEEEEESSS